MLGAIVQTVGEQAAEESHVQQHTQQTLQSFAF